jgi:hypothetical protein
MDADLWGVQSPQAATRPLSDARLAELRTAAKMCTFWESYGGFRVEVSRYRRDMLDLIHEIDRLRREASERSDGDA